MSPLVYRFQRPWRQEERPPATAGGLNCPVPMIWDGSYQRLRSLNVSAIRVVEEQVADEAVVLRVARTLAHDAHLLSGSVSSLLDEPILAAVHAGRAAEPAEPAINLAEFAHCRSFLRLPTGRWSHEVAGVSQKRSVRVLPTCLPPILPPRMMLGSRVMSTLNLSPELKSMLLSIERSIRFELRVKKVGLRSVRSLLDGMNAGLEKHSFSKLLGQGRKAYNDRTTAEKIWKFLEGDHAIPPAIREEIRTEFDQWLATQRQTTLWQDALAGLKIELGYIEVPRLPSAIAPRADGASVADGAGFIAARRQDSRSDYPANSEPMDSPHGRSTGSHRNWIGELCHAKAEWRSTNLGHDEGRWLQLWLRFKRSYTRTRGREDVELSVHLHRVHVDSFLDGGVATSRDPWTESSANSGDELKVFEGNSWEPDRPCYEIDNPVRSSPLAGDFSWFDLCEVRGTVGEKATLEITVSLGGISIQLPDQVLKQLDPSPNYPHDTPELRLIEGWLRHRLVPPSRLRAGLYQLTQIELQKSVS